MIRVGPLHESHRRDVLALVATLPDWFDRAARSTGVPVDLHFHHGFVAVEQDQVVGFATFTSEYGSGRLSWIAVDPRFHRRGIGRFLLQAVEGAMRAAAVAEIRVETVGWSRPESTPYAKTRAFYEANGFRLKEKGEICQGEGFEWQMYVLAKPLT